MVLKRKIYFSLGFLFFLPIIMWLFWLGTPKKKLVAIIVDKTVGSAAREQHSSFTWILNNQRFAKNTSSLYNNRNDYFGFFPLKNEKFRVKGLERFSPEMLEKLSNDADMVYFTDTYGVYKNEWYHKDHEAGGGLLYGGMSEQDIQLLQDMKSKHKLIISEFNTIGSPTSDMIRGDFENLFGLKWSGWTGRYFSSLDSTKNADLPKWIINNYIISQHQWPFREAGIVFVNEAGEVVILENGKHLLKALPSIKVSLSAQKKYDLPSQTDYPFWFDVMNYDSSVNNSLAEFEIRFNENGKELMMQNRIPAHFPAILAHQKSDYSFYYFSGNFCDNPVSMGTSYFKGISFFKSLFYNSDDLSDRRMFFWNFYKPLMKTITEDYYGSMQQVKGHYISYK